MSCQDFPYFQKSKKILHSHWLRACIHSSQKCIHLGTLTVQFLFTAATLEGGGAEIADTSCLAEVGDTFREARSIQHQITGNVSQNYYQRSLLAGQSTILEIDRLRKKLEVN